MWSPRRRGTKQQQHQRTEAAEWLSSMNLFVPPDVAYRWLVQPHGRTSLPGELNDTVCAVKTLPSASTNSISTLCWPRGMPARTMVLLCPKSAHSHGRSSTVMCRWPTRGDRLRAAGGAGGDRGVFGKRLDQLVHGILSPLRFGPRRTTRTWRAHPPLNSLNCLPTTATISSPCGVLRREASAAPTPRSGRL
jgi:hypothetical protein